MKTKILLLTALMAIGSLITISLVKAQNTKSIEVAYSKSEKGFARIHNMAFTPTYSDNSSRIAELDNTINSYTEKLKSIVKFKPTSDVENIITVNPEISLDSLTNELSKEMKFKPEDYNPE
jgi:hypothetical protein